MNFSRQLLQEVKPVSNNSRQTQYNILGKQKDICQAVLKPCVPIYVKRDNLILLQANNNNNNNNSSNVPVNTNTSNVSLSAKWIFPFSSFIHNPLRFLFDPPIYHRLVTDSTDKTTCLIGSNNGSTLCHVNLNGLKDWYLKPSISNRIVSMEETSTLHIKPSVRFKKVGMKFIKADGRGSLVIQNDAASSGSSNNGGIYSIVLEENENCIIKRDNLLGISGDSFLELSENLTNFEFKETTSNSDKKIKKEKKKEEEKDGAKKPSRFSKLLSMFKSDQKKKEVVSPVVKDYKETGVVVIEDKPTALVPTDKNSEVPDFSVNVFLKMTYDGLKSVYEKIHHLLYQISTGNLRFSILNALNIFDKSDKESFPFSRLFQNKFIKVSGPRTLLVQSNPANYTPRSTSDNKKKETSSPFSQNNQNNDSEDLTKILNFNNTGYNDTAENIKHIQKLNDNKYENMKYLSKAYVDVKNGKVMFESVDKF